MIDDYEFLLQFGGLQRNSLNFLLNAKNNDQAINNDEIEIIKYSPYFDEIKLKNEFKDKTDTFKVLSLNCESINAKFDQLVIKLKQLACCGIEFSVICLQETWLSNTSDLSLLTIEGFNLISQGRKCTTRGGLMIYIKEDLKFKELKLDNNSDIWEVQFVEIFTEHIHLKIIIIGNIYRPPRDINANYQQFIDEFTPTLDILAKC